MSFAVPQVGRAYGAVPSYKHLFQSSSIQKKSPFSVKLKMRIEEDDKDSGIIQRKHASTGHNKEM